MIPNVSAKFAKQQLLPDLLRHAQPITKESQLQTATQIWFIHNCVGQINAQLASQDEELVLNLLALMDGFKASELEEISEAAFSMDPKIRYNIGISQEK